MRTMFRTLVEIPIDMYKKVVLLVASGEFANTREVIIKSVEETLNKYDDKFFNDLAEKYKPILERIDQAKSIVVRKGLRRWKIE